MTTPPTPPTPRTPDPAEEPVGLERFEDDDVELVAVATVDDDLDDELDEDLDDDIELGAFVADEGPTLVARLGSELLGTFAFVLVLVGVAMYTPLSSVGTLGVALAAGLALAGLTAALGHVSGAHLNPAVTLGAAVAGRTRWADLPLYWLAQVLGGLTAVAVLFVTIPERLPTLMSMGGAQDLVRTAANGFDEGSPLWTLTQGEATFNLTSALILEAVATAILVAVVLGSAHRRASRSAAPLAVGLTYAAMLLLVAPATGGALNPARATAAAVFAGGDSIGQLWLFWVAPLLGAALVGFLTYAFARPSDDVLLDDAR